MTNPWFKFYAADYLKEVKFLGVDANRRSCFVTALCYSAASGGKIDTRYLTNDMLKMEAGVPMGGEEWNRTGDVYHWLVEREMGYMEDHYFVFKNWEKRQESYLTGAERVRKHRNVTDVTLEQNRTEKNRTEKTLFDRVWAAYPKKQGKAEAQRAFDKLKADEELTERIISAIALAKTTSQWKDNEGRYIPHCSTWLNQHRFEDELPVPKPVVVGYEQTERGMRPVLDPEIQAIVKRMKIQDV